MTGSAVTDTGSLPSVLLRKLELLRVEEKASAAPAATPEDGAA